MEFKIGKTKIGANQPTYIIAEIGMNHNGDIKLAKKMIKKAQESGANAVKFQTFNTGDFLNKNFFDYEERKKYELSKNEHLELLEYSNKLKIDFFSTPLDLDSLNLLDNIGVNVYKIASCDLNNLNLIKNIALKQKPVIFSTGYASVNEIFKAYETLLKNSCEKIAIMHCIASYPTKDDDMNLKNISMLKNYFPDSIIGFSDHSKDYELFPSIAVAMGAKIIEKHFTTNNNLPGYDHKMSLNPDMFSKMVKNIRRTESSMGKDRLISSVYECEVERITNARRALYWSRDGKIGELIDESLVIAKRPGIGISPIYFDDIIGNYLSENVKENSNVIFSQIKK